MCNLILVLLEIIRNSIIITDVVALLTIRIRKPLITLRHCKSGRGEEADVYEYICHIFAEYDDNVYFKGTKSEEAVFIWAENIYKLK